MKFIVTRWWVDEVEVNARSYADAEEKAKDAQDCSILDRLDVRYAGRGDAQ